MRDLKKKAFSLLLIAVLVLSAVSFAACSDDKNGGDGSLLPKIDAEYTVTYYDDDRTLLETKVFAYCAPLTYPDVEREGYYTRWKYYDENDNEISYVDKITSEIKLVAYYEVMDFQVTVMDDVTDDKLYEDYLPYGDVYTPALDTSKPGYVFLGYRLDGEDGYRESFSITGAALILAEYRAYEYELTFKDDMTDATIKSATVNYGEIELPSAEKEGYTFDGWYMQINAVPTRVGGAGDTLLITGDTVLWASYTANSNADA